MFPKPPPGSSARTLLAILLLGLTALEGCGGEQETPLLTVEGAWARAMTVEMDPEEASPGANSAVYLEIRNRGREADRLLGGETTAAARVELHESLLDGDVVRMREVDRVELPPSGVVALKPGGLHLMLLGLQRSLVPGDTILLTLRFEVASPISVPVPVRGPGEG